MMARLAVIWLAALAGCGGTQPPYEPSGGFVSVTNPPIPKVARPLDLPAAEVTVVKDPSHGDATGLPDLGKFEVASPLDLHGTIPADTGLEGREIALIQFLRGYGTAQPVICQSGMVNLQKQPDGSYRYSGRVDAPRSLGPMVAVVSIGVDVNQHVVLSRAKVTIVRPGQAR